MGNLWKASAVLGFSLVVAGVILVTGTETANARPKYRSEFKKKYSAVVTNHKITCLVCHEKKDDGSGKHNVKKRNNYGKALMKVIGKKNEKSSEKIKAALTKTEKEDSGIKGKTFGDLLKDGKLPASTK